MELVWLIYLVNTCMLVSVVDLLSMRCAASCFVIFFFKQKTAYEMRISDWSSDVCSSDLDCSLGFLDEAIDVTTAHVHLDHGVALQLLATDERVPLGHADVGDLRQRHECAGGGTQRDLTQIGRAHV